MSEIENKNYKKQLIEWYETLEPSKRKKITIIGGGGGLFLIATILITFTSEDGAKSFMEKPRKVEYTLFNGKSPRDVSIDAMAGKIKKLTEDFTDIRSTFQRQDQKITEASELIKQRSEELSKKTEKLGQQQTELYRSLAEAQEMMKNQVPLPEVPIDESRGKGKKNKESKNAQYETPIQQQAPTLAENDTAPVETGPKIRIVTGTGEEKKDNKSTGGGESGTKKAGEKKITEYVNIKKSGKDGMPDMFLPAGSILSGTLVTGLDAPTANQTKGDPFPALLRVKHEAILPNRYRMDIRECFLIASGYGDLSAERAYMRAERMSCVKKDGGVIEVAIDAYSVGEDGKAGVRGRLVSKNGQLIANALLSGFVSGITQAFAPQKVQSLQTQIVPGQQQMFQYPSPEMLGGQALMGGVKGAAEQIADYYLEMAKNIFPIIEVDAGRKIDFIMIRGTSLSPKTKNSQNTQAANYSGNQRGMNNGYSRGQDSYSGNPMGEMLGNAMNGMSGMQGGRGSRGNNRMGSGGMSGFSGYDGGYGR